jgi:hypothetical protein
MKLRLFIRLAVIALLCGAAVSSQAATLSAEKVAGMFRAQLPGSKVRVVDDLTLQLRPPNGGDDQEWQVNLDRVAKFCSATPSECDRVLDEFVANLVATAKAGTIAPKASALRAVVRSADYAEQLAKFVAPKGDVPISRPFAGGLVAICYLDAPTAMRPVLKSELGKLGLEPEHALDACIASLRAALPRVPTEPPKGDGPGKPGVGVLEGNPYMSSYLLLHDDWNELAGKLGGRLLVAAPDANVFVYVEDSGPDMVKGMATTTKDAYDTAERPISPNVFRWTPTGWDVAAP